MTPSRHLRLSNAANPGVLVEGLGKIGLPRSERDALELCRISHEAPFGKVTETFVDKMLGRRGS